MSFNFSSFVNDLVPEHISTEYPELTNFITVYALYLEKINKSGFYLNQLDHQRDIDLIETTLLNELQNEIGTPIPRTFEADPHLFYKHLVEFYRSRGTPESITAFFKLIYDEEVEISFPKDEMMIPSDGKWLNRKEGIIADKSKYAPSFTWTIASASYIIFEPDDNTFMARFDDDVVFINDVYTEAYVQSEEVMTGGMHDDHMMTKLVFESELQVGDIVQVYKRGVFDNIDSFISDNRIIQDSHFWQKFSYVLKTGKNIDEWKNAFTRLIHPAGFVFFGEILIFIQVLLDGQPKNQPGFQRDGLPFAINIEVIKRDINLDALTTFVEKSYNWLKASNKLWAYDHFDNLKFKNYWPIREYANITFIDVINKSIGTHIGSAHGLQFMGWDGPDGYTEAGHPLNTATPGNPVWGDILSPRISGGSSSTTGTSTVSGGSSSTTGSTTLSGGSSSP